MAIKKLTVKAQEAARKAINKDEEEEKKQKNSLVQKVNEAVNKAVAEGKPSAPPISELITSIGTAEPGANKNFAPFPNAPVGPKKFELFSGTTPPMQSPATTTLPKTQTSALLYPDLIHKYLEQGMAYIQQGPQSRMDVFNSLTGFDIGDYEKGDVNSLNYDVSRELSKRNQYFMDQHRQQGTFDFPEFLAAGKIIGPSTDYLTKQNDAVKVALEESKAKDATAAASKEQNADQEVAWQNLYKAKQEEKDFFDEWYNLLLADHLLNNSGQIWDFEAADARYGEDVMDDATYEAELKRLREQMQGVDWATKTGYNTANYESQTPALQAQYDLISGELTRRNRIEELEAMADSNPNYAEWSVYQEPDTAVDPAVWNGGLQGAMAMWGAQEDRWSNKQNFINNWHQYRMTGGYDGEDNSLAGKIVTVFQNIGDFFGYNEEDAHGLGNTVRSYIAAGLQYMSDEQILKYNVLYKMGPEYAEEYLELISPGLLAQKAAVEAEYYATRAQNLGTSIWDNAVGFAKKPWGAFNTMLGALSGETDPNAQIYGPSRQVNVTREATGEALAEISPFDVFGVPVTKAGYDIFTSIGDMLVANKIGTLAGGLTGKADAAQKVMSFVMSSGAGTDTYLSDLQNGQDPMYAAFHGMAIGGIEAWSESGFIDSLFSPEGKFIARVAKSAGSEGLEEIVSEGGGMAVDLFMSYLTGQENEIEKTYAYYAATLGKDKAALATLQHYANNFALAAVSGTLIGGGTSAVVNTGEYLDTRATGKAVIKDGDIDTIVKVAQSMPAGSESKQISDEITAKQGKGKKPSFYQFGQLTKAIIKDLGEERAAIVNRVQDEAIADRLVELGEDRAAAKQNASIIRRIARGEKVPRQEMFEAKWSDNASQVVKELTRETKDADFAPGAVEDVGASMVDGKWVAGDAKDIEANRTGNKWVQDMKTQQLGETAEVQAKLAQVHLATMTPIGKAANRAEEAAKKRVPKRDGKPKLATDSHVTFRSADGNAEISGDFMRFEESDEGMDVVVQTGKGKEGEQKAKLKDWISADGDGVATILSYIGDDQLPHSVTAEEANTLMQVYKRSGGNAKAVIQAFDVNYLAGYSGVDQIGSALDPGLANIAYENGKRDAEKDEEQRKQRASEYKALENPVAGWIGKVDGREQVKGLGDAKALEEALQAMPESQRTAAEIMIETGKAVGLNVVLYDSDGKGAENDIQNGAFDEVTHTVYFDVSAWVGNTKQLQAMKKQGTLGYALLRVGGHELTHYLEVAAPEAYAKYSKAVKDALKAKGVDFAVQMRERIDNANAQGRKLTMAGAAAEVIADASEDMLRGSKLFNSLDTDTKGKIRAFLQNFAQKVKEIFQHLTGGHKESAALQEMKNGVHHYLEGLQDLWDAGFDEILAKGTTDQSGDATEMVEAQEVKYSLREYDQHQIDNWANSKTIEVYSGNTQQVLDFVERSIANKTLRKKLYFGKVSPELAAAIYEATGVRTENMNLALHSDEVLKILADHGTKETEEPRGQRAVVAEDFAEIIEVVTSPDTITRSETDRFGKPVIEFAKEKNGKRTVVTYTSEKHNDLRVQTMFIGARKRSLATPMDEHASINTPEASSGTASNNSVPKSDAKVNPDVKNSDRDTTDQTETEAFKRWFGDSKVVNDDGTPKVMYHGTPYGGFTVFKDWQYFTDNKEYADVYHNPSASSIRGRYNPATKPQTYEVYLSVKKPFDTRDPKVRKLWKDEFHGSYSSTPLTDKGLPDWTDGIDLVDFIEENGYDYDAIILDEGGVGGYGDDVKDRGISVVVRNSNQIKSATDNVGTFGPENPDILYSDRDLPDGVTIREYLGGMKPTSSMTETEKLLLKRYQDQLHTLAEKEKLVAEQDEIIRNTPAGDELTKAKNRRKIYRDQADRAARAISNAEKDEGFARLMVTSRQVMNDYLTGAGGNVADASDALDSEVRALTDKLKKLEADITRTSDGQRAAFARGLFNPDELKAAAKILKSNYGSRMSVENIANRLALAYGELYAEEGAEGAKRFSEAARDLAVDLLKGNKFRYRSDILPTLQEKIGTISLSETDIQEIKHHGYTLREYKNMLSPYIKVTEGGSDISSYASNAQYYDDGTLAAILGDDTEGNLAMRLYDVISHEKSKEAEASYEGMTEGQLVGMAMADIASANLPMSTNDSTVEYLRKELLKYAGQNANIVRAIEEAISNAKQTTRRASKLWHEAVKVSETAKQAVKYYRKLDEHRRVAELADQKQILTEQLKGDAAKTLQEMRARYQEQIDNIRLRRDINIDIGKKTRHIKRVVKALNDRIVHEEDYKNVKEPLKPAVHTLVRTFIDGFGNLVFDQKTADRLRGVYDAIADENAAPDFYSDDVANWLSDLASMKELDAIIRAEGSSSLSAAEEKLVMYSRVADIADHIYKMVTDADEIFINGKRASIAAVSGEVGDALVAKPDKPLLVGKARDAARIADDLLRTGNMTPQYFFDHLKNSGLTKLFDGLMDGQQQYAQAIREGQETVAAAKDKYNFYSWQNMKEGVEFRTEQGHRIALTVPQMMWVYATAKREATNTLMDTHHLDQGGFRYESNALPREKGKMTAIPGSDKLHKLSAKDVAKITDTLTAEQKACADELVGYLSEDCAEMGNEASMKLFGIKKYNEEYYFPFKTAGDQRYQRSDAGSTSTTNDARVKHASFTHSLRKGANTPLVMGDFFDVIADHINMMATYSSFVVPIESMNRVLNTKVNEDADGNGNDVTIRSLVGTKYGEPAQKYIADLMKDLNGGPQTDNRGGISALFRAFKRGAVLGSLSVSLQQPTAIARAMAYVNPKYFLHLTGEGNKKTWERMMRYSGTTVIKDMGKFDVGTGKMANDWIANSDLQSYNAWTRGKFLLHTEGWNAVKNNFVDFLTSLPGVMDRVTWTHIWKAIEAEQADLNPGMDRNSDDFLTAVGKRFDDVINHTQVYDSILAKSQNMRSKNPLTQMSTAFMSEPTLNINMLYDAVRGEHDAPQRAAIITSVIASNILAAAMASLISAWNKDDDDRKLSEKYLTEFANRAIESVNPLTMIPYVADLWSMFNGYDIERTDLSVVKDVIEYTGKFFSNVRDPEKANTWRDYENFFGTIANLLGVPAKNIFRDIRRVRNLIMTDKSAASGSSLRYSLLETITPFGLYESSNTAYYERLLAATMDGDKQEMYDLKDYLMSTKGVKEDTVKNGVVNAYKKVYLRGGITKTDAVNFLVNNDLVKGATADKKRQAAFKKVDEWDEGSEDYSVYNTIFDAVKSGNSAGITEAIKEMTANGYVESDVISGVRSMIRESYMEGTMTQSQVKTAYRNHFAPKSFDVNDQNDWYWLFRELDWGKTNGNSTDGYSNYIFLKNAFSKYNESAITTAWRELAAHGYEDNDVKTYIRTYILKPMVQEGNISTSRATDLLNRWAPYNKYSDNTSKPLEWLANK